jgi:hypothetical protein
MLDIIPDIPPHKSSVVFFLIRCCDQKIVKVTIISILQEGVTAAHYLMQHSGVEWDKCPAISGPGL